MSFSIQRALFPKRALDANGVIVTDKSLAVSTSAVAASTAAFVATPNVGGGDLVVLDIQGADMRVRWDGVNPTSSTGHILPATTAYTWDIDMWNNAVFIRDAAATADGVIWVSALNL